MPFKGVKSSKKNQLTSSPCACTDGRWDIITCYYIVTLVAFGKVSKRKEFVDFVPFDDGGRGGGEVKIYERRTTLNCNVIRLL